MKRTKSIYLSTVVLLALPIGAAADIIQFDLVFEDSSDAIIGHGSFDWNTDTEYLTDLVWDFGSGMSGGYAFTFSQNASQILFELFTGSDVHSACCTPGYGIGWALSSNFGWPVLGDSGYMLFNADLSDPSVTNFNIGSMSGTTYALASQVPEPGTLALLGIGLFGMSLARRRRKA